MSVYLQDGDLTLHHGDAATVLADLPEGSVDCVVTSPPYFGLRDYGVECQIGLEPTPEEYVAALVGVFREVWRVLAPWGTCWVNIGDSYAGGNGGRGDAGSEIIRFTGTGGRSSEKHDGQRLATRGGAKPKDLLLIPARLSLALQADGWWVRSRIEWTKPNPMPESVTDRPTSAHEDVYLLTKAPRYYYDAEAVREDNEHPNRSGTNPRLAHVTQPGNTFQGRNGRSIESNPAGRNLRNVWSIATEPTPEAHFATFPTELVRRCLAAGCPERVCRECGEPSRRIVEREEPVQTRPQRHGVARANGYDEQPRAGGNSGLVAAGFGAQFPRSTTGWTDCGHDAWRPGICLDPFAGSGTTALVARRLGLHAVGIDASAEYLGIAEGRLLADRARKWVLPGPSLAVVDDQLSLLGGVA